MVVITVGNYQNANVHTITEKKGLVLGKNY